jgi:hypothetical protein
MTEQEVVDVGLLISDGMGGDYSLHFMTPELLNEFKWLPNETANKHHDRTSDIFGQALENEDPRLLKSVYTSENEDPEKVNLGFPIRIVGVVSHQAY